jgi:hypothetical protein
VRRVDNDLRVGDVMDGRNHTMYDPDRLVKHLDDWCKAVRRARRGRQQMMLLRLVELIVHSHHDIEGACLDRRGHDHFFHAGRKVRVQRFRRSEFAAAFKDDVHVLACPGHVPRLRDCRERDRCAVDLNLVARGFNAPLPPAVHRIERQKVCRGFWSSRNLVDVHELHSWPSPASAQGQPAHPAEAIDPNSYRH